MSSVLTRIAIDIFRGFFAGIASLMMPANMPIQTFLMVRTIICLSYTARSNSPNHLDY